MTKMINVEYASMDENSLEYIVSSDFTPSLAGKRFQVISAEEARELYFPRQEEKTNVYVIIGGQKGDEGKGMGTELAHRADNAIGWTLAPNSTHNAGKGVHTTNLNGDDVKVSLHLCPATLPNPNIKNYIGQNVQANLFSLEKEILAMMELTGRRNLGEDYHLMIDSYANLVVPVNRAEDVVCKPNAMGSTVSGATASRRNAVGKTAPCIEHVLYDTDEFISRVNRQIQEFNDFIKHDSVFVNEYGITDIASLGRVLKDKEVSGKNVRLSALANKLSVQEIDFFVADNPAEYLLEKYKAVCSNGFFFIGDCKTEINNLIAQGIPGEVEGVQATLLSGGVKYSKNTTSANTHGAGTIGDANLDSGRSLYRKIIVMKFGNTSVGGNDYTMSGFVKQDALAALYAMQNGENISFEKTDTLLEFITREQRDIAFNEVTEAFFKAISEGYSLRNSKVSIKGINMELSLAEARALLTASKWGEKGETSKRARVCRMDDLVETGVVYNYEGTSLQVRNAVDRAMDLPINGIITAYKVVNDYGGYSVGDVILPGMPLRQEHLTVRSCIPIVDLLHTWDSISSTQSKIDIGTELHPNLSEYLSLVSGGNAVIAIGAGPKLEDKHFIKEI
jgi:adenylosuccinate synthase